MNRCMTERVPGNKGETEGRKKKKQRPNKMREPKFYSSVFIHETIIRVVIWFKMQAIFHILCSISIYKQLTMLNTDIYRTVKCSCPFHVPPRHKFLCCVRIAPNCSIRRCCMEHAGCRHMTLSEERAARGTPRWFTSLLVVQFVRHDRRRDVIYAYCVHVGRYIEPRFTKYTEASLWLWV